MPDPITTPDPAAVPAPPAARTFTQEEVNAIAAREKDQGAASAQTALAAKLTAAGLTDIDLDAAIALAAQARTADDARKTDAERERDAAILKATAAEQALATAQAALRTTQITAALTTAGATNAGVAARAIILPDNADTAAITAAVEALKTEAPGLFTAGVVAPHSDGGTGPANQGGSGQAAGSAGLAEAEKRFNKK